MESSSLLFESVKAAQEVALMLQAQWDGCNCIEINGLDYPALQTAAKLANSHYCQPGDSMGLPPTELASMADLEHLTAINLKLQQEQAESFLMFD